MWKQLPAPLVLGSLLLLGACDSGHYRSVSLDSQGTKEPLVTEGKDPLRIGFAPILSPLSGGEGLISLCGALAKQLGKPVAPLLGGDYRETNDLLALGQLDAGIVCSGAYADPRLERACEPLLVPLLRGAGNTYESYLIVRADAAARRLEDLRGCDFVFTDALSLTGYIHPLARLCSLGRRPESFFSRVSFSHSHDRSIALVADGRATAAAVDSAVFLMWVERHPLEAQDLRILEKSEPFPSPPIVVRASLPASEKQALRRAFLELGASEEGKAILAKIGWSGFQVPDAAYHKRMAKLLKLFRDLRGQHCLPA